MFQNKFYQDLTVLSVNTAPLRNYYVPFATKEEAIVAENRQASSRFLLLDGQWDFEFYSSIHDIPVEFSEIPQLPLNKEIPVPSCIQNHGYDAHQYVNVSFPIPYDPPYTPYDNPCGIYRRSFDLEEIENQAYYLNFEGVDSNIYLWVNDQFVGYDQVTHSNSEFDVSDFIQVGKNEITVLVMKWCVGTYFEDQDKFRTTGITRSVYLLQREKDGLWDYKIETPIITSEKLGLLNFTTSYTGELGYTLLAPNGEVLQQGTSTGDFSLTVSECTYWSAEVPNLYTLILEAEGEYIREKVGFREFTIKNRVLYLNDQPIKLYGVNHHDSHPDLGPSMLKEDYRAEMEKMKGLNMNGIRTAHYPKSPEFYELADEMGFYVISEADIESHGVVNLYGESADYNLMARDETFGHVIEDRIIRSVIPFQNRPSIFMWSMQNESGYGVNYEKAQEKVRALDATRLIHNERAAEPDLFRENDFSNLDVISRMYSPFEDIVRYCEGHIDKPFIQCEYAHAMGNGPGDLADYFSLMEKYPSFIGGFVWEWADHAMYYENEAGNRVLGYGGDFGERLHDSNFCVDGLIFPDRRLTSSAIEYRNIHSPIQLKKVDKNRITLRNIQSFLTGGIFSTDLTIHVNGKKAQEILLDLSQLKPLSELEVSFTWPVVTDFDYVTVDLVLTNQLGEEVARQQKMIQEGAPRRLDSEILEGTSSILAVEKHQGTYQLSNENFTYTFDSRTGTFSQLIVQGEELLVAPSQIHLWRAPIDNDRNIAGNWRQAGYETARWNVISFEVMEEENAVILQGHYRLGQPKTQNILRMDLRVRVQSTGEIEYNFEVIKGNNLPDLPRFGVVFPLSKSFEQAKYLGYGPYDSYIDKHYASHFGCHDQNISEMFEDYLKPQENGNHWKTVKAEIVGIKTCQIDSHKPFNFSFIPYSAYELTNAPHSYDLPESSGHYLTIDYKQNGIGSYSCGPYLKEKYRFDDQAFNWAFRLSFF